MGPSCKGRKKECKAEPCIRKRKHGVFALLVETLNSLIQVKYQTTKASPFDSHDVIMSVLLAALCTYATASVAEVMLLARESPYCTLVGNLRLFAGALAAISLLCYLPRHYYAAWSFYPSARDAKQSNPGEVTI